MKTSASSFHCLKTVGIVSQARMTSSRLPGKVLRPIAGQPLLRYHVQRLRRSRLPVYLAITTNTADDPLAVFAEAEGLPYFRGDEHDVLSRYGQCAERFGLDVVVRVTSDCPLIDGALVAEGVRQYLAAADEQLYVSNVLRRTFPRGLDFEVFSRKLLAEAVAHATLASDLEHVTPYIHQNRSGTVRFQHVTRSEDDSALRLTVDTEDDFRLIETLITHYRADQLNADELIALLAKHPELVALNAHVEQKKL